MDARQIAAIFNKFFFMMLFFFFLKDENLASMRHYCAFPIRSSFFLKKKKKIDHAIEKRSLHFLTPTAKYFISL